MDTQLKVNDFITVTSSSSRNENFMVKSNLLSIIIFSFNAIIKDPYTGNIVVKFKSEEVNPIGGGYIEPHQGIIEVRL